MASFNLIKEEVHRRIFQLSLLAIPIGYHFLGKWKLLSILIPVSIAVISLDFYRHKNQKIQSYFAKVFGSALHENELEQNKFCDISYVLLAFAVIFLLFKSEIAILGTFVFIICGFAAAIVEKCYRSEPFFEKTLYGSAAFFIIGILILITLGSHYHFGASWYCFGLFSLFAATIIEARPSLLEINSNFIIPFSFALTMSVFDIIWNYNY